VAICGSRQSIDFGGEDIEVGNAVELGTAPNACNTPWTGPIGLNVVYNANISMVVSYGHIYQKILDPVRSPKSSW
jgi:hypothetical protein